MMYKLDVGSFRLSGGYEQIKLDTVVPVF